MMDEHSNWRSQQAVEPMAPAVMLMTMGLLAYDSSPLEDPQHRGRSHIGFNSVLLDATASGFDKSPRLIELLMMGGWSEEALLLCQEAIDKAGTEALSHAVALMFKVSFSPLS